MQVVTDDGPDALDDAVGVIVMLRDVVQRLPPRYASRVEQVLVDLAAEGLRAAEAACAPPPFPVDDEPKPRRSKRRSKAAAQAKGEAPAAPPESPPPAVVGVVAGVERASGMDRSQCLVIESGQPEEAFLAYVERFVGASEVQRDFERKRLARFDADHPEAWKVAALALATEIGGCGFPVHDRAALRTALNITDAASRLDRGNVEVNLKALRELQFSDGATDPTIRCLERRLATFESAT